MMLGLPPDTHPRELVKIGRTILTGSIPPKIVATGPVKQNILKGADVDLYEFPSPHWNRLDGGRYLLTYGGCVTKDPETGDHECRHLSRHGRRPRPDSDPDVARATYRTSFHRLAERRQRGNADRGRDRLGAVARLYRRLAGAQGHVRIRRHGRHSRRAGRTGEMRDRRPLRAGGGRDRDRGLSRPRSRDLCDGRPLSPSSPATSPATARPSRPSASPPSPTATIRSCAAPSKARCPAAIRRTACAPRSCARRRRGTCSTAPACRGSPTCGVRRYRPASTSWCG